MVQETQAFLYFWVIGDMHFRAREEWKAFHTPRMRTMFNDLHTVWDNEGLSSLLRRTWRYRGYRSRSELYISKT